MNTRDLMRELRLLGQVEVPQASLKRVWMRVLAETGKAGVPELNPAQGRVCAARPVAPSFDAPSAPARQRVGCPGGVRS